jgi:hypothetical protein
VRPFLPSLVAGALASAHLGVDFDHSPYSFVGQPGFLLLVFVLAVASYAVERRQNPGDEQDKAKVAAQSQGTTPVGAIARGLAVISLALGALLFAATVTTSGELGLPALVAGVLCAGVGYAATTVLFARARRRLDSSSAKLLSVYGDLAALAVAAVAIFAPPLSFVALAGLAFVAIRVRRTGTRKYEGLRILR